MIDQDHHYGFVQSVSPNLMTFHLVSFVINKELLNFKYVRPKLIKYQSYQLLMQFIYFQIMPQILYYLKLPETSYKESFNFGVLAIYTCPNSCDTGQKYKKEFLWEQSPI